MLFIFAPENLPFTVALALMFAIAALEGVTTLFGAGFSHLVESFLPDTDVDFDVDADADLDAHGGDLGGGSALSKLLGWLYFGKVPFLVLLVAFLTIFGIAGLVVQGFVINLIGVFLPAWLATIPAFAVALPAVRLAGRGLARIIPSDETSAVSVDSFIGRVATITLGVASQGHPAQAKLQDQHDQVDYVMVEPDNPCESFETGERVLLVAHPDSRFRAIRMTSDVLTDG